MEKKLAIAGKKIIFTDIEKKSLAQFKQQLRQNKIEIADETAYRLYMNLRGELTEEQKAAKAEAEKKAAEMKAAAKEKVESLKKGK